METIGKHIQQISRLNWTGNFCGLHPDRSKPVEMMLIDDQEVCPVCVLEEETAELARQEKEKYEYAMSSTNYNVFHKQSLLTDTDLLHASFSNYETTQGEEIANKESSTSAFQRYKQGETFNTWFTGSPGVGKSHLAMSILRNLNESGEKDKQCLFVSVDEMLLRIRNSFSDKESKYTEFYFTSLLSQVDYLALDDLGAETGGTGTTKQATDFTLRVLYAIANARQSKSTIITTNLSKNELVKMYDPKLVSRLMKNMHLIKFEKTIDKRPQSHTF